MAQENNSYVLRKLDEEETNDASPNMYRAIIAIDGIVYQIGDDWQTKDKAFLAIIHVAKLPGNQSSTVQVYDDKGKPQFVL